MNSIILTILFTKDIFLVRFGPSRGETEETKPNPNIRSGDIFAAIA